MAGQTGSAWVYRYIPLFQSGIGTVYMVGCEVAGKGTERRLENRLFLCYREPEEPTGKSVNYARGYRFGSLPHSSRRANSIGESSTHLRKVLRVKRTGVDML